MSKTLKQALACLLGDEDPLNALFRYRTPEHQQSVQIPYNLCIHLQRDLTATSAWCIFVNEHNITN